ncbi:11-beta-hydroxysteroid dehydrogenase 1A-like isoform X2 [Citrus sinensis]|uniref:11-beta-hydroxysteroid dehydrogenase 1A-like isoform X2 n=1 Tax=Citrus sinensis TaxID=2711 RepID=UPI000D62B233|nr:11-beta-hydroxysteroid dehydrogenase 1A-like isoform X2 [Citrus sinensis]
MDLINKFLNLVAPPFTLFSLCLFLPPFLCYKFLLSVFNSIFSEDVSGKVVIITGASSGIGEHLAYEYARRGACLALCARREKSLEEVADTAREIGSPDVITIRADVSKVDDCRSLVEETMNHFGRLDHLVNNAGISSVAPFEDTVNITDFKQIMDINFWGSVYTTRFAVPHLRYTKGKIAVLSSSASWLTAPRMSFYNAQVSTIPVQSAWSCAKAIVNSVCRGDTYLVVPSWFRTTYWMKVLCPELLEFWYRVFYMGRPEEPSYEAPSQKVSDYTGAQNVLYPSSDQSADIKTE